MNPSINSLIKFAILITFLVQVSATEYFGHSQALENVAQELQTLRLTRRQLERLTPERTAVEERPARGEATQSNVRANELIKNRGDNEVNNKRGENQAGNNRGATEVINNRGTSEVINNRAANEAINRGTNEVNDNREANVNNREKGGSKGEELVGQMFDAIGQMANSLEALTSLASSKDEILENSKKVQDLIPQVGSFAKNLMATASSSKSDELNKSFGTASDAAESIAKSLKAIEQKPEDANLIKEHYKSLEKSFQAMLSASDAIAVTTVPRLAELAKNGEQNEGAQRGSRTDVKSN